MIQIRDDTLRKVVFTLDEDEHEPIYSTTGIEFQPRRVQISYKNGELRELAVIGEALDDDRQCQWNWQPGPRNRPLPQDAPECANEALRITEGAERDEETGLWIPTRSS